MADTSARKAIKKNMKGKKKRSARPREGKRLKAAFFLKVADHWRVGSAGWNRFRGRYLKPVCESEESPAAPQSCQYNTRVYFNTPSHPSDDMGLYVDGDHGDMDPSGLIWAELTNPRAGGRAGAGLSLQRSTKRYSLWTNESIDGDRVDRVWVEDDALCGGKCPPETST